MRFLVETLKKDKDLHHAYLIKGSKETILPALFSFFEKNMEIKTSGNPDFWVGSFDTFTISDSRALTEAHIQKAFAGEKRIFVISANSITSEAQNALLKTFEDAVSGAHFFLVFPSSTCFLPTFLSRLHTHSHKEENTEITQSTASDFLSSSFLKRMSLLKDCIESKDKAQAINFLDSLEEAFKKKSQSPFSEKEIFVFEEITKCRKYLTGRSPSVKMILEYLSLVVPTNEK
ncbi:MAG: hypothetical protein KAR00_01095 [Candidatus Pacebacteria bacterium]|nr:hypothetical protein [Candidatus Paceibacterota bacterium]